MKIRLAALFLIAASLPADAAAPLVIVGHGSDTCAEFAQGRVISPQVEESYYVWAQGFMSGVNTMFVAGKAATRNLVATSEDSQKSALRDYCSKNPNDLFQSAVVKVLFAFPEVPAAK